MGDEGDGEPQLTGAEAAAKKEKRHALREPLIAAAAAILGGAIASAPTLITTYFPPVKAKPVVCATEPPPSGVEVVQAWARQSGPCWQTVLPPINTTSKVEVMLRYSNEASVVRHDVVVRVGLPKGAVLDVSSELLRNDSNPNDRAVDENLATTGVNTGAYANGGDVYLKVDLDVSGVEQACGVQTHTISVFATSSDNSSPLNLAGGAGFETYRRC